MKTHEMTHSDTVTQKKRKPRVVSSWDHLIELNSSKQLGPGGEVARVQLAGLAQLQQLSCFACSPISSTSCEKMQQQHQ